MLSWIECCYTKQGPWPRTTSSEQSFKTSLWYHLTWHCSTDRVPGMFAKLVVPLWSSHSGGSVKIHNKSGHDSYLDIYLDSGSRPEWCFRWYVLPSKASCFSWGWSLCARYSDVSYEVRREKTDALSPCCVADMWKGIAGWVGYPLGVDVQSCTRRFKEVAIWTDTGY